MLHWTKIDGVTIKRTLSILTNPKRYNANVIKLFKEEILEMFLEPTLEKKEG
jgi:hypothetical protein